MNLGEIILCLVFLCPPLAFTLDDKPHIYDAQEIIKKVENLYFASETFEAEFRQVYIGRNFGEIESRGEVFFKRPGMMKWVYEKPDRKLIVSDGNTLWIYDRNDAQVIVDKSFRKENVPSPVAFLWGEKRLAEVFNFRILSFEESGEGGQYRLELVPKKDIPNVNKIHFVIDSRTFAIIRTSLFDLMGNENRLSFIKARLGRPIKNDFFKFKPPRGIAIVEPPTLSG
jgi:outer membrane lipoprotein carrier protein